MQPRLAATVLNQTGGSRKAAPRCGMSKNRGSLPEVVAEASHPLRKPVVLQTVSFRHRLVCVHLGNSDDIYARWQPIPVFNRTVQRRCR